MKTFIALGFVCSCALLGGCGDDGPVVEADQIRPPAAETVAPPGSTVKIGSNEVGSAPAKPKAE